MTTLATIEQPEAHNHTLDDVLEHHADQQDPGIRARSAVASRAAAAAKVAKRILYRTIAFILFISVVVIGAGGYYVYATSTKGYVTDHRSCELDVGGYTVTGERTYSYPYTDFLMWRNIDKTTVTEKTLIDVKGTAMTVVGITGEDSVVTSIGEGERGTAVIKAADTYVFMINKKVASKSYKTFCK